MGKKSSAIHEDNKKKKIEKIAIVSSWGKQNMRSTIPVKLLQNDKSSTRKVHPQTKPNLTLHYLKKLDYLVQPTLHFSASVRLHFNVDPIKMIKENLNAKQIDLFRNTCFGHFLDMETIIWQPQLIHSLLLREVYHENPKELWFRVNDNLLKFGIDEFALITGLNCIGNYKKLDFLGGDNTFLAKYFNGSERIDRRTIVDCFYERRWDNDVDAVKLAMLMFVHVFLLSSNDENS